MLIWKGVVDEEEVRYVQVASAIVPTSLLYVRIPVVCCTINNIIIIVFVAKRRNFNLFLANLLLRRNFLNYLKSRSFTLHANIIAYQTTSKELCGINLNNCKHR